MNVYVLYRPGMVYRHSDKFVDVFLNLNDAKRYPLEVEPGLAKLRPTMEHPMGPIAPAAPPRASDFAWILSEQTAPLRWDLHDRGPAYTGYSIVEKAVRGADALDYHQARDKAFSLA